MEIEVGAGGGGLKVSPGLVVIDQGRGGGGDVEGGSASEEVDWTG